MSAHAENLGRAARLLRRIASIEGGPNEFEDVPLETIIEDVLTAQMAAYADAALGRTFACDIDESAGLAEVVELNGYSRKVPCE